MSRHGPRISFEMSITVETSVDRGNFNGNGSDIESRGRDW